MQTLRWMRVPGDSLFAIGALVLVAFVFMHRKPPKKTVVGVEAVPVQSGD